MLEFAPEADYLRMKTEPFKYSYQYPNCVKYYIGASTKPAASTNLILGLIPTFCIIKKLSL
jgi:hypothetical protein